MIIDKVLVKDDINFLENPNWVVSNRNISNVLIIEKEQGSYEVKSTEGLPTRFDKIVLYYLLHRLFEDLNLNFSEICTTRYEIAKNVFHKKKRFGKPEYDRIMLALKRWKAVFIKFEGLFFEGDNHTIKYFSILDYVSLDKKTKILSVKFNDQYIRQLKETKFYKLINFHEYKKLMRPVSVRLYEILIKNFKDRSIWQIDIKKLAEKITLEKRAYPSQVLVALKPAINEINRNTELKMDLQYDNERQICIFRKLKDVSLRGKNKSVDMMTSGNTSEIKPATGIDKGHFLLEEVRSYSIPIKKAKELVNCYPIERIKHKIELLKQNKKEIKNVGAWLTKAIEEDWDNKVYNKHLEEQARKEELQRKKQEKENLSMQIDILQKEHTKFKEFKAQEIYSQLPLTVQRNIDIQFITWLEGQKQKTYGFTVPEAVYRQQFLIQTLLDQGDIDFEKWVAAEKKIKVKKVGHKYQMQNDL